MGSFSSFLFAEPDFVGGMARTLDIGDTLTEFNRSASPLEADYHALFADWLQVGDDLGDAYEQYRHRAPK